MCVFLTKMERGNYSAIPFPCLLPLLNHAVYLHFRLNFIVMLYKKPYWVLNGYFLQ